MMYMAGALLEMTNLKTIREFILERNHINVMCVARHLVVLEALLFIREFILERNHINEVYVVGLSV